MSKKISRLLWPVDEVAAVVAGTRSHKASDITSHPSDVQGDLSPKALQSIRGLSFLELDLVNSITLSAILEGKVPELVLQLLDELPFSIEERYRWNIYEAIKKKLTFRSSTQKEYEAACTHAKMLAGV